MAVAAGYKNVNWMRVGIKGWHKAFYAVDSDSKLFMTLMDLNQGNPSSWVVDLPEAGTLKNPTFLDIRPAARFEAGHLDRAINIPYAEMWTFENFEKLNKSKDIVLIHDDPVVSGAFAMTLRLLDYRAFILQ
ncbi:MAG TPA: rhodanese-like domain-containing protein [Syntrophobacteraceae bacterium]|nr:rhodanese-like domain-containing protein [Syntrophobacteraceae bacterium]